MKIINEEEILKSLLVSTRASFDACKAKSNSIVGFAIVSDDSAVTFSPIAATSEGEEAYSDGSKDDFFFNPENWDLQENLDAFDDTSCPIEKLYEFCDDEENDDNWHEEYRSRIYQIAVRTLETLKIEGYFSDDVYLNIWVVDSYVPFSRAKSWSKRLNNEELHCRFVEWLDSRSDEHC